MGWRFWRRKKIDPEDVIQDLNSDSAQAVVQGLHRILKNPQLFHTCQVSIERCFKHKQPHVRWYAAKVAAATGGCAVAETLAIGLLDDGAVGSTTAQLLTNLGARGVPAIKSFLWRDAVRNNPAAIRRALDVLVVIDDDPVKTIFSLLNSQAKQFALDRFVGFGATALPVLLEGYRENERGEAALVVEILGKLGDLGTHALIDLLLERPAQLKRRLIIAALWQKKGSFFDLSFFGSWRSPDELLDQLVELVQDADNETGLVSAWMIREFLPFASAAKREQIESSTSFILLGDVADRLRKALERVFHKQPDQMMLLAA